VFKDDAGTYQIESLDLLKIRLSEVPAIAQLENMSATGAFTKEIAQSAARPVEDAAHMVEDPMDTVTLRYPEQHAAAVRSEYVSAIEIAVTI
jgi:hypothetical protein